VTIYADTSVLVALVFDEPDSNSVRDWFRRTTQQIIVSDLARLEFPLSWRDQPEPDGSIQAKPPPLWQASICSSRYRGLCVMIEPISRQRKCSSGISRRSSPLRTPFTWRAPKTPAPRWPHSTPDLLKPREGRGWRWRNWGRAQSPSGGPPPQIVFDFIWSAM
jgi:hypothetical protein